MSQRLITPSKITAWLDCPHYLTLRSRVDTGQFKEPNPTFGSFARLLQRKGQLHEDQCLNAYENLGKSVYKVPQKGERESFAAWVERVGNPLSDGHAVIYQMPFTHDGIRGVADFLERMDYPDGRISYEPVDAKLARAEAKPGHVLQLCFYVDAINNLTGVEPERMHIDLGSGHRQSLRVNEFRPYWRRLRGQLTAAINAGPDASTAPEKCSHCEFCEFLPTCEQQWREEDSLIFIPGIRPTERAALDVGGIVKLAQLGELDGDLAGIRPPRLSWLVKQANLQLAARLAGGDQLPYDVIVPGEDARLGRGFERMPQPDDGDVFLDFEGDPFWRPDTGLFFLFGLIQRNYQGKWAYRAWWAHDLEGESAALSEFINYLAQRRQRYPTMHAYHYNNTERTALQQLASKYGIAEAELGRLIQAEVFVDLLEVARNSVQVGAESYSLKCLERLTDFQRSHVIDKGAGAVVSYENFMATGSQAELDAIAAYNEDDVRATRALRDWLVAHRPADLPWREPPEEPNEVLVDISDHIAACHRFDEGTPEHLLGDLLGYWTDEWWAYIMPKMAQCQQDTADLLDSREAIADLTPLGLFPRIGKRGRELKNPSMRFTFPPQQFDALTGDELQVMYTLPDGTRVTATVVRLDTEALELDLEWGERNQAHGYLPKSVVSHSWVGTEIKRLALFDFAAKLLERRNPNKATEALLRRDLPRFHVGHGPSDGAFTDDLDEMLSWATQLDHSYVAVQGPPGTGKTYRAGHIVHALVKAGQRVGITAPNHRSIENVLREVIKVFTEQSDFDLLQGVRNKPGMKSKLDGFKNGDAAAAAKPGVNVVAGTSWMFSSEKLRDAPVDVLLIDEAGQYALADALAVSTAARNLVLLGDPLQLAQVNLAVHPGGGGLSALGHVIGDDVTLSNARGVFIEQTRRMHPDVCRFISDQIYEGRLSWDPSCENQTTAAGTGLRWLKAEHRGNSTSSVEEALIVAEKIAQLIGTTWTNFNGHERPLKVNDFMVVTPYNAQRRMIREVLERDPRTAGVPVGSVDKFQGGTAAVVFFSMATSTGEDVVRGADFLFSRARLNVAISRARCLAYLVCTEQLLETRAKTVEQMRLIGTLNAFVEWATPDQGKDDVRVMS